MKKQIISVAAGLVIGVAGTSVQADIQLTDVHQGTSQKDASISACIGAIRDYHAEDAKLFLNNKAQYRQENGERILTVSGWVWKGGERVRVSHQCMDRAAQLALNVQYEGDVQVATSN